MQLPPGVHVVVVDSDAGDRYSVVDTDQADGARQAVQHLLDLGHRHRLACDRPAGLLRGTAPGPGLARGPRGGRAAGAARAVTGDWSAESGYAAGLVLAETPDCTAVFAANDQMALGLLRAFHERGRPVPHDVSVVGFDDIPDAAFFVPPLTTVHQDFAEVGHRCVQKVLQQIRAHGGRTARYRPRPDASGGEGEQRGTAGTDATVTRSAFVRTGGSGCDRLDKRARSAAGRARSWRNCVRDGPRRWSSTRRWSAMCCGRSWTCRPVISRTFRCGDDRSPTWPSVSSRSTGARSWSP